MHVHKPMVAHSVREFVSEIGIIVVGVLIALGAEQLVELAHQENKAAEANDIVRGELALISGVSNRGRGSNLTLILGFQKLH